MMFYTNESSPKRVVEIIKSLDGTLLFNSKEKLEKIMKSINFILSDDWLGSTGSYESFVYKGDIHGETVYLKFFNRLEHNDIKLLFKCYLKLGGDLIHGIKHREYDLPAMLQYSDYTGETVYMAYYLDNVKKRSNNQPIMISIENVEKTEKILTYYNVDDYSADDFSIYSAYLIDDKVVDARFCYNKKKVTLEEIVDVIPEIKWINLSGLESLKESSLITPELRCLLAMKII